jgi:hypothetical protein
MAGIESGTAEATFLQEFDRAKTVDNDDRVRGIRNTMAYLSLNSGQWPEEIMHELKLAGRNPNQYNFLQYLIRGHGGNLLMNWVDPTFQLRDSGPLDAVEALGKIWYANKEQNNYKADSISCYEDGYCYRGVQELRIKRPSRNPRDWSIEFPCIRSDLVIFDPHNLTDRISRNAKRAWKMGMYTAGEMIRIWDHRGDDILRAQYRMDKKEGDRFERIDLDKFESLDYPQMGNSWMVVEKLWIRDMRVKTRYLSTNGIPDLFNPIPDFGAKMGSPEDVMLIQDWAARNGYGLDGLDVMELTDWQPVNWITTMAPHLGIMLEDRKDERQLNGHLPLYAWSFIQKRGKSVGLVDLLWDVQQDFNKRQMAKTKGLTQTPIWGKTVISEDIVDENSDRTLEQVVAEANDCSKPLVAPSGLPIDRLFQVMQGTNIPSGLLQDEGFKLELADRIASLPMAMQGIMSRSGQSGLHFGRSVIEGSVMQRMPTEWIHQHENDKAEDFVIMGIKLFGSRAQVNREFRYNKGREAVRINEFVGYDADGKEQWRNDISKLKRVEVIIGQTSENQFMQQARAEAASAALQSIPPTPENAPLRASFEVELALNMQHKDDESKERTNRLTNMYLQLVEAGAQARLAQIQGAAQQMGAPPGGQPGAAPPGEMPMDQLPGQQQGPPPAEGDPRMPVSEEERVI